MNDPAVLLQLVVAGLAQGSIYALVALGFNIIFKTTDAINFAQGEWVMAGGMIAAFLYATVGMPLIALAPLAALSICVLGVVSERLSVYPLRRPTPMLVTLITIGVAIATKALVMLTLGKSPAGLPGFSGGAPIMVAGAAIHPQAIWIVAIMIAVMVATHLFFERTLMGKAMQAVAADREAAAMVGIGVRRIVTWSFALAALVGAIAGIIITPLTLTSFAAGTVLGFKGFSAAMLGGLGNIYGAVVGGLLLGVLESLSAGLISSQYKDAVAFLLLLIVLFLRPAGLLGRSHDARV
jgi:branched-chain amino acid transport system permease protein